MPKGMLKGYEGRSKATLRLLGMPTGYGYAPEGGSKAALYLQMNAIGQLRHKYPE